MWLFLHHFSIFRAVCHEEKLMNIERNCLNNIARVEHSMKNVEALVWSSNLELKNMIKELHCKLPSIVSESDGIPTNTNEEK